MYLDLKMESFDLYLFQKYGAKTVGLEQRNDVVDGSISFATVFNSHTDFVTLEMASQLYMKTRMNLSML